MLNQRKDVSSTIGDREEEDDMVDPNTYSTYMGKQTSFRGGKPIICGDIMLVLHAATRGS